MLLGHALHAAADTVPDKPAILVDDRRWSFADLERESGLFAASLVARGVRTGDRVALHFTNGFDVVCGYYACFRIGAIAVPLNTRMKGPELAYVVNHSGSRIYIGDRLLFGEIDGVRRDLADVEHFVVSGHLAGLEGVAPYAGFRAEGTTAPPDAAIDGSQVAAILYTSGTTAHPKGVTHTHDTLSALSQVSRAIAHTGQDDISGVVVPICHIFGLGFTVATLASANTTALIPRFDPPYVLDQLERHRVTIFGGLPVMLNALLYVPDAGRRNLSHLRVCFAGGDAVPLELHRRFKDVFGVAITEACGMTELNPYACNEIGGGGKVGSIGRPAPGVELRLVDALGGPVADGDGGEVLARGPAMMVGYWNDPDATSATIQDGWLRTGDLARVDADGYYWFVGRKKEIIVRAGSNISPVEVEDVLYQHPAVREAGVVGIPDAQMGEIVRAFVAMKPGASATEDDLKAFVGARLAAYKVPERIVFAPDLPKGLTGKVQRKELKSWVVS